MMTKGKKMRKEDKKYRSNYFLTLTVLIGTSALFMIGMFEQGGIPTDPVAYMISVGLISFMAIVDTNMWIKITNDSLISSGQSFFRRELKLVYIKELRRVRLSRLFKTEGAYIAIYDDNEFHLWIRETNYSDKTIKEFVTELKKRIPSLKLDPQYEDLIAGMIPSDREFKKIPATHNNF